MFVGSFVETMITLSSSVPVTGELQVVVMRDIPVAPDQPEKFCVFPVSIGPDPVAIGPCTFQANLLTSSSFLQYYFRLFWNDILIYSPSDSGTRAHVLTR